MKPVTTEVMESLTTAADLYGGLDLEAIRACARRSDTIETRQGLGKIWKKVKITFKQPPAVPLCIWHATLNDLDNKGILASITGRSITASGTFVHQLVVERAE